MSYLRGWMYGVGALYLITAFLFNPLLVAYVIPGLNLGLEPGAQRVLADGVFFIGAIVAVLGIFLLRGASYPHLNRELVKLVIWVEVIAGTVLNVYVLIRGYGNPWLLLGSAAFHGIVAAVGRHALTTCRRHLHPVTPLKRAS